MFCSVEGGRGLLRSSADAGSVLHRLVADCILHTLRSFPSSYLCRKQEGELKYLLAFGEAKVRGRPRQHRGVKGALSGLMRSCNSAAAAHMVHTVVGHDIIPASRALFQSRGLMCE